jgi:hypothetical protein
MPNSLNFYVIFNSVYVIYGCGHGPHDTTCSAMATGWKPVLLCLALSQMIMFTFHLHARSGLAWIEHYWLTFQ